MVVHPAPGHYEGTLVNAVMYHCQGALSGINGVMRPGIVHRIDKDTTGSVIVCKMMKRTLRLPLCSRRMTLPESTGRWYMGYSRTNRVLSMRQSGVIQVTAKKMAVNEKMENLL